MLITLLLPSLLCVCSTLSSMNSCNSDSSIVPLPSSCVVITISTLHNERIRCKQSRFWYFSDKYSFFQCLSLETQKLPNRNHLQYTDNHYERATLLARAKMCCEDREGPPKNSHAASQNERASTCKLLKCRSACLVFTRQTKVCQGLPQLLSSKRYHVIDDRKAMSEKSKMMTLATSKISQKRWGICSGICSCEGGFYVILRKRVL